MQVIPTSLIHQNPLNYQKFTQEVALSNLKASHQYAKSQKILICQYQVPLHIV